MDNLIVEQCWTLENWTPNFSLKKLIFQKFKQTGSKG